MNSESAASAQRYQSRSSMRNASGDDMSTAEKIELTLKSGGRS